VVGAAGTSGTPSAMLVRVRHGGSEARWSDARWSAPRRRSIPGMTSAPDPRPRRPTRPDVATGAYLVVLAVAGVQLVLSRPPATVTAPMVAYAAGLLTYLAVVRTGPRDPAGDAGDRWLAGLTVLGGLLAAWLLVRFALALPGGLGSEAGYYRVKVRVTSPVGDHNTAAGLLLVPLAAAVSLAVRRRRWWPAVGLLALGSAATLSRGAALVLLAVGLASWWVGSSRRFAVALAGLAATLLGVVLGAAALLGAAPPPGAAAGAGPIGTSVVGRLDLAVRGIEVAAEAPLLGHGFGTFAAVAADLPVPNHHAHQLVAHAAAEGGLLTAAAVLALSGLLLVRSWRLPRSPVRDVTLLGGAGLLLHAQVEILGALPAYEVLLAAALGLATAAGATEAARPSR
jgi:O-antigen ligase